MTQGDVMGGLVAFSVPSLIGNLLRTLTDLAALGIVFLLRKLLPFDYTWMLIATAVALSIGTIVISYRIAGKK